MIDGDCVCDCFGLAFGVVDVVVVDLIGDEFG